MRRLAQGHLSTQLGGDWDQTSNFQVTSLPTLPPELGLGVRLTLDTLRCLLLDCRLNTTLIPETVSELFVYVLTTSQVTHGYLLCDWLVVDPGKYNYTPRLFWLDASSGLFRGEEQLSPARVPEGVMAMPFLQENLYSAQQPGTLARVVGVWPVEETDLLCLVCIF